MMEIAPELPPGMSLNDVTIAALHAACILSTANMTWKYKAYEIVRY